MKRIWRSMCWASLLLVLGTMTAFAQQTTQSSVNSGDSQPLDGKHFSQSEQSEAYKALADVLENPQQRDALIAELRQLSGERGQSHNEQNKEADSEVVAANPEAKLVEMAEDSDPDKKKHVDKAAEEEETINTIANSTKAAVVSVFTLPKKITDKSTSIATSVGKKLEQNWRALTRLFSTNSNLLSRVNSDYFWSAVLNLSLVICSAILLYQALRYLLLKRVKGRLDFWVKHGRRYQPIVRRFLGVSTASGLDALALAVSYFVANAVALYIVGERAAMSTQASLFINAFIVIELLKIGIRVVFYQTYSGLRFLPGKDETARTWYHWLSSLVNLIGYGYLVAVPLVAHYLSYALGQAVATVIAIVAFIYGVTMVMGNRKQVKQSLHDASVKARSATARVFLGFLSIFWHWIAVAYFLMLLVLMLLEANNGLPYVLSGTLYTILIIGGGLLASSVITQIIGHRINLPKDWQRMMPGFEKRINTYIPLFLRVAHFIILMFVIFGVLSSWDVFAFGSWLTSETGRALADKWIGAGIILIAAAVVWMVAAGMIEHRLSPDTGSGKPSARAETLLSLFKNGLAVIIGVITVMMVLSQIGVNIGPLIAGAGVLGLAIGFGSQKLVQDIITGIFIQIENAMNTGDVVTVDGITGTAEHISIRTVSLRDVSGTYHIIPFSNVTTVSNYMRGYAYHKGEYGIGYNEDIDEAVEQLKAAFDELAQGEHKHKILEPITVSGVTELADSSVNIRILIKTTPGDQWAVGRAYNRLVKIYFDRAGIEIPYPHTTLYFGELKDGSAPPANLRITDLPPVTTTPKKLPSDISGGKESEVKSKNSIISKNSTSENNQPDVDGSL
ncbi:mechanosensitive ion channel [Cardiobacteriaceae bacterium TAE3-ERU3]|nr:mechanosensitive ion channel [Cardiobacteriaceae bacterium TAE3-ERU3]